ncbi:uncharacterized protein [Penaeus vannamei]|uniref:uncharacterized protein n=1 Tax=Penaeus vannamei TaxID=6689 RepID=UPI00387F43ED
MGHQRKTSWQMISYALLLTLHFLYASVDSFRFATNCVPRNSLDTDEIGSKWDVKTWVPKDGGVAVLSLISKNDKKFSLRKIDITRTELHALFRQGIYLKNSSLPLGDGISPGWAEFRVTSDSRFKVWVAGVAEPLVDVEDDVQAERVFVKGSNVTINCREPFIIWNVSEDREAALPVDCPGRYDLAVFSRSPSSPVVTLGNWTGVLSWDPEANIATFAEPRPMPAFTQHNFTLNCSFAQNHFKYNFLAGQNDTLVGSVSFPEEVAGMSFRAENGDRFVVTLQNAQQEQEAAMTSRLPDPGTDFEKIDTYFPVFLNGVLAVICVFLGVKIWQLKMKMTSPEVTKVPLDQMADSAPMPFPPALPQETVPLNGRYAFQQDPREQ